MLVHRNRSGPSSSANQRRSTGRLLSRLFSIVLIAYAVYAGLLFVAQRHLLFPGQHLEPVSDVTASFPRLERYWLTVSDGRVEAWYLPPRRWSDTVPGPALIFTHGNGELIDFWPEDLSRFRDLGIGVMLVEYPGYGRSSGSPSQKSITQAVVAAYDLLTERPDVDPRRIIVYGRSVGGGAACALVREREVAALILQSTFTSVASFAKRFLLPPFLVLDDFDNLEAVASYGGPVLVIHGARDDQIPYAHGVALSRVAANGSFLSYDCVHDDCGPSRTEFWSDVSTFLDEHGLLGFTARAEQN